MKRISVGNGRVSFNTTLIAEDKDDHNKSIVLCPYCKTQVKLGDLTLVNDFLGCHSCIKERGGLRDVTEYLKHKNQLDKFKTYYNDGFKLNRLIYDIWMSKERNKNEQ